MPKEHWTGFSLEDLVSEFDAENAQLDNSTVFRNQDRSLRELVIFLIQLVVGVEEFEHLLVDGTSAPTVCLRALGHRAHQIGILTVLDSFWALRKCIRDHVGDVSRVNLALPL